MKIKKWTFLGQDLPGIIREIIVLVLGILIAFWLNNWWTDRLQKAEEAELIEALFREFELSENMLDTAENELVIQTRATLDILMMTGMDIEDLNPVKCDTILGYVMAVPIYAPFFGVVQEMLNSGQINLLKNDRLRALLAAWPNNLSRVHLLEEKWSRRATEIILPYLYANMSFVNMDSRYSSYTKGSIQLTSDHDNRKIFKELEFQNMIEDQYWNFNYLKDEYGYLRKRMNEILSTLEKEIKDKSITLHED